MKSEVLLKLLELKARGASRSEKAEALGISYASVYPLEQDPAFKKAWNEFVEQTMTTVKEQFIARAEGAGARIERLANQDVNLRVALSASQDILDRAGFKPKQEVENVHIVRIERADLQLFSETARELGTGRTPGVVEGEFKVLPVLSHEDPSEEESPGEAPSHRDGGFHSDEGSEDSHAGASRPLQDDNRLRGLPPLAVGE